MTPHRWRILNGYLPIAYISGPMSHHPMKNQPAFNKAESWLRSKGYEVINPCNKPGEILTREATEEEYLGFMKQDICSILYDQGGIDEMWMLPGWHKSKGAVFEFALAKFFKIPIKHIPPEVLHEEKNNKAV
jgi:hypothetical protein